MKKCIFLFLLCNVALLPFAILSGASSTPIILGQTAAFSGVSSSLGHELRTGILAALNEINKNGGIRDRDVVLVSKDDGYEPYRASQNAQELIDVYGAFILIGNVGTPTTEAIVPILESKKVPLLAPYTGAISLRVPFNKYLIHTRASYRVEIEKIVEYLVEQKGVKKIACFYQNDSYGLKNLQNLNEILKSRNMVLASKGLYERNTVAVLGALKNIHEAEPEAVILIGSNLASAEFIKLSKIKENTHTIYCNISFGDSTKLQKELGSFGENVLVSQVVPYPWDTTCLLVQNYTKALAMYQVDAEATFNSFEGYIAGRLFAAIAHEMRGDFNRENFLTAIAKMKVVQLDDVNYSLVTPENPRENSVYITTIYPEFKKVDE